MFILVLPIMLQTLYYAASNCWQSLADAYSVVFYCDQTVWVEESCRRCSNQCQTHAKWLRHPQQKPLHIFMHKKKKLQEVLLQLKVAVLDPPIKWLEM